MLPSKAKYERALIEMYNRKGIVVVLTPFFQYIMMALYCVSVTIQYDHEYEEASLYIHCSHINIYSSFKTSLPPVRRLVTVLASLASHGFS